MSATVLRDFAFRLGFQVDEAGLKKAEAGISRLQQGWGGVVKAARQTAFEIAAGATLAGVAIGKMVADTAKLGDETAKTARSLGLGVEEIQELRFAAERSGTGIEALRTGIRSLARQADDFGVTTSELLERAADAIAGASSDTERLAIAQQMLGRSGAELLPMLRGGAAGLRAMRGEARALGVVLDERTTDAAETFADRMQDLRGIIGAVRNQIGAALLPVVNDLASGIVRWWTINNLIIRQRLEGWANRLGVQLRRAGRVLSDVDRLVRERLGGWGRIFAAAGASVAGLYAVIVAARFAGPLLSLFRGLVLLTTAVTGLTAGAAGLTVGLTALAIVVGLLLQATALGGLVLLIDDLNVLINDGDSAIGRWIDSFRDGTERGEAFADMLRDIAKLFGETNALIYEAGIFVSEFFTTGFAGAALAAGDLATEIERLLRAGLELVGLEVPDIFRFVGSLASGGAANARDLQAGLRSGSAGLAALRGAERDVAQRPGSQSTTNQTATVQVQVDARGRDAPGQTGAEVGFSVDRAIRGAFAGLAP